VAGEDSAGPAAAAPVQNTTIRYLVTRPAPASLPYTRLPFYRHVFRVTAAVILVRHEADDDFHLGVERRGADGARRVTGPVLHGSGTPARRAQMASARAGVRVCAKARVTGVAFTASATPRRCTRLFEPEDVAEASVKPGEP